MAEVTDPQAPSYSQVSKCMVNSPKCYPAIAGVSDHVLIYRYRVMTLS